MLFLTSLLFLIVMLRYLIFAGGLFLLCWVWKRETWEWRRIVRERPPKKVLQSEFLWSCVTSLIFAITGALVISVWEGGGTLLYTDLHHYGIVYAILSLFLMMLIHETYFYWTHRLLHAKSLFRRVHYVHHESKNPTPWAAFSFHPIESIIEAGFLPLIVFFMPTHVGVFLLFLMIMTVTSVFNHLGYELYPLAFVRIRLLRSVITATHHQMHHRLVHCNYGLYFTWWDMIMKTHHKGYPEFFEEIYSRRPTEKNVQILGNRVIEPAPTSPASG